MTGKIIFKYDELDDQGRFTGSKQLSFVLAVFGNFSGGKQVIEECVEVNQKNFNVFVKEHRPTIRLQVPNLLFGESEHEDMIVSIDIKDLRYDFKPSTFYRQVGVLSEYLDFLKKLETLLKKRAVNINAYFLPSELKFFKNLGLDGEELNLVSMIHLVAKGYEMLNKQVNYILYHPTFQEIESNWLSLINLLSHTNAMPNVKVKIFDMTKEALADDLVMNEDITDTELFYNLFVKELDQYGGEPINMVLNTFNLTISDFKLARGLGDLGKTCSCPVISNISGDFFDVPDISYLMNNIDLKDMRRVESFLPWVELAKGVEARFLGFLLPLVKLREEYSETSNYLGEFPFVDDNPYKGGMPGLYGSTTYAFSLPFLRSYEKYWTCFGAEDEDCAVVELKNLAKRGDVLDCIFTEKVKKSLGDFGIMSFTYTNSRNAIKLGDLNMFSMSGLFDRADLTIEQRMNVRLPQLLFISQISHYMRMIKRNSSGNKSNIELKNEFLNWLKGFISDTGGQDSEIMMTKPLKSASVDVVEVKTKKGSYTDFRLSIQPHARYRGLQYGLNL